MTIVRPEEDKMGTFKFKDLLVNVVDKNPVAKCLGCSVVLSACHCSFYISHPCYGCTLIISYCQCISYSPSLICPGTLIDPGGPVEDPIQLAALKEQLTQTLAQVEAKQQAAEAAQKPQTVAEADELQSKLEGALEELKAHRSALAKKK